MCGFFFKNMQVVILAAGKGTRMRPLTYSLPKPMAPLYEKPKLQYTLEWLPEGVDEIILVVNYLGEKIKEYFGNEFRGIPIKYVVQKELNGTGGALHYAKDLVGEDFLVMMGDDLYHKDDIKRMMRHKVAVLANEVEDPSQYGILLTDEKGHLLDIKERPHQNETNLVNTGMYKLTKEFFDFPLVPISDTEYGLPQTLVAMREYYPIAIERATCWKPLGKVDDIAEAEQALQLFAV